MAPNKTDICVHESENEKSEKPMERTSEDLDKLAGHYQGVLKCLGEDPDREGLKDTPMRAAKALMFFTKGKLKYE